MNATVQLVVAVLAAVVTGGCGAYIGLHRRLAPGARAYRVVMLSQMWWSLGYVGELLAGDVYSKVFRDVRAATDWDQPLITMKVVLPWRLTSKSTRFFDLEYSSWKR